MKCQGARVLTLLGALLFAAAALAVAGETLDGAEKRSLDTFFSNFSEAEVPSFTPASLSDQTLLDFALRHNYINRLDKLKRSADGYSVLVTAGQVDETTEKYFARTLTAHHGAPYVLALADGEPLAFSQVNSLRPHGDGQFLAEGVVYWPGGPGPVDVHGNAAIWDRQGAEVSETATFRAIIERLRSGGSQRWVLREYTLTAAGAD